MIDECQYCDFYSREISKLTKKISLLESIRAIDAKIIENISNQFRLYRRNKVDQEHLITEATSLCLEKAELVAKLEALG